MRHVLPIASLCLLAGCNLFTSSSSNNNMSGGDTSTPNNSVPDAGMPDAERDMGGGGSDADPAQDMADPPDVGTDDMAPPGDTGPPPGDFGWDRSGRVQENLLLHYTFEEGSGIDVLDRAIRGGTPPLTLGPTATWVAGRNGVHVGAAERITGALVGSEIWDWVVPREEITVEAWLKPDNLTQDGPARMVTFSANSSVRNFTIGQRSAEYIVRFSVNDSEFGANGTPDLYAVAPVTLTETHVAITYDGLYLRFYVNGVQSSTSHRTGGLQHWDRDQVFVLGNENVDARPWAGEFYMLAVYDRALTPPEIAQNFVQGSEP